MEQSGTVYTLVGPDSTTVQLDGTGAAGSAFVLSDVDGLDSPEVRTDVEDLPEQDGAVAGSFFLGSRPIVLTGRIKADTVADRNAAIATLSRASLALRADAVLQFQPDGMPALQVHVRRQQRLLVGGGYVKEFQLQLVAADPRIYSQLLNTVGATGTTSTTGAAFPLVFPVNFGGGSGGTVNLNAANAGNVGAPPVLKVTGPVTNPQVTNSTTGESLYLDNLDLVAGEYVTVDVAARTVAKSDGANLYARVRFPDSAWWLLAPGTNLIQLWAAASSAGVQLDVSWRDSWV